jgi:hypothetical protein
MNTFGNVSVLQREHLPNILFLGDKTNNLIGISETLVSTSAAGIFFALLAGQPLIIIGATGPLLLFDESLYSVSLNSKHLNIIVFSVCSDNSKSKYILLPVLADKVTNHVITAEGVELWLAGCNLTPTSGGSGSIKT